MNMQMNNNSNPFPATAPVANPVFYRTYSRRKDNGLRETWEEVCDRTISGLAKLGKLTADEVALLRDQQISLKSLPSGRWLWVGGTEWIEKPENFHGAFNCTSTLATDWKAFGLIMNLAMQGCGTGAVLENRFISQLPVVKNEIEIELCGKPGSMPADRRKEHTQVQQLEHTVVIVVGDSRKGWVDAYQTVLEASSSNDFDGDVKIIVDLGNIRPEGEKLKGFGGVANPRKLPGMFPRVAEILNGAVGRRLTAEECCLLIDEPAVVIVSGNIRRCLPEDALVHTSKGLVPIKDVQVGDLVQTPIGFRKVLDKFDQGVQDVYDIETNCTTPRATLNHRIATFHDAKGAIKWKKIEDLKPEDRLMHNNQVLQGTVTHLPPDFTAERPEQSRNAKPIIIPDLTPEVAWLIGFTHGNGYVSLGQNKHGKPFGAVTWAMNSTQTELMEALRNKIDAALNLFGLQANHTVLSNENTGRSSCTCIRLAEYFYRYIKQPKKTLRIPSFILQGSVDVRAAYLAGLFDSDGSLVTRPPILVTTVYPQFAREVGCVLSSMGIAGRIKMTRPQKDHWKTRHSVTIPAFKKQFNSLITPHSAKGSLKEGLKMYGFTLPGSLMRESYTYSEMKEMGFQGSVKVDSNYERYQAESDLDLNIPVTVKGLGSYDSIQTYDIEVEEAHCFYCDGYLTHNSAGMRQFDSDSPLLKMNLWEQDLDGNWKIDPKRDALRSANHTRVYHNKPTQSEILEAVSQQFFSGEGAIQYAPEAIARASADLLNTEEKKQRFIDWYNQDRGMAKQNLINLWSETNQSDDDFEHRLSRYSLNPCGEIIGVDFHCNLSEVHLNQLDPFDLEGQEKTFQAGAIAVAALLKNQFVEPRYQRSRELDPIVGVSLTGLFDFFVQAFGADWLKWWEAGRPEEWSSLHSQEFHYLIDRIPLDWQLEFDEACLKLGDCCLGDFYRFIEQKYLSHWRNIVTKAVWDYCDRHNLKRPNRCTTVQPAGCLDKNALRVFDQGLLYADEIVSPGSGETKGIDLSVRGGIAASTAIANNPLNLVCVELKNGRILRMTPNHKLMIGTKWIEACDMKPGMEIEYKLGTYKKEEDALLVNIHASEYTREYRSKVVGHCRGVLSKSIKVPTTLNPDLAYFIGAMFGNGCLSKSKSRIRFCHSSLEILGRLSKIGEKLFGMTGTINGDPGGNKHELVFASVQLFDWFVKNNIGKPSKSVDLDRIPEPVRRSSKSSILAFFAGLIDTDGCPRNGSFSIDMASEKFIRNLQQVGEAVGLGFSVSNNTKGSNFQKEKNIWTLSLSRMTSDKNTIADLNALSTKLFYRPIQNPKRQFKYKPYSIKSVTLETTQDYSYDFAVEGKDYDDSWYWQGGLKSHNTKSLLTGASSGWHPPKAQRFIRRVTFRKYDPVAMACIDFGYSVVPSQSDKDENGVLLNNPFDDRCTEWLVEIPVEVPWANLPGADTVDLSQFSALAQFDFYMQVQKHYVTHNTSATIELRQHEIEPLAERIYQAIQNDEGYISAALLARFDDRETYPRLPFEPISKEQYEKLQAEVLSRRETDDFNALLARYDQGEMIEAGPAGCDSDKCLFSDPSKK